MHYSLASGDVIIKGGALKSRGLEKFQRVFLKEEMIEQDHGREDERGDWLPARSVRGANSESRDSQSRC